MPCPAPAGRARLAARPLEIPATPPPVGRVAVSESTLRRPVGARGKTTFAQVKACKEGL
ncbi:hypothetical protein FRACA_660009 [Frankia canadensis]|uniref:Uncharacterized protein n=1 Tax=Frankia canadensis TaxID=1836972 RepID=A0A2I2L059_9ACTN|nr:hypothetical protein FRACA_660009 [Frankia canadensis]SOU58567.1 hypothetical protein FRACA_660009 [Frankia canadensis]